MFKPRPKLYVVEKGRLLRVDGQSIPLVSTGVDVPGVSVQRLGWFTWQVFLQGAPRGPVHRTKRSATAWALAYEELL